MVYNDIEMQRAAQRRHYEANKEWFRKRDRDNKAKKRAYLNSVKDVPCMDCGEKYPPYVMDFDHVRGEKLFNLGSVPNQYSMNKIKEEIDKCEIVCSNCHRERTYQRSARVTGDSILS